MKGSRPAHVDVGLVEGLKHLDEVGTFPLKEQRHVRGGEPHRSLGDRNVWHEVKKNIVSFISEFILRGDCGAEGSAGCSSYSRQNDASKALY